MRKAFLTILLFAAPVSISIFAEEKRELPSPEKLEKDIDAGWNDVRYIVESKEDITRYEDLVVKMLTSGLTDKHEHVKTAFELAAAMGPKSKAKTAPLIAQYILDPDLQKDDDNILQPAVRALARMDQAGVDQAAAILKNHTQGLNGAALWIGKYFGHRGQGRPLVPLYAIILDKANGDQDTIGSAIEGLNGIGVGIEPAAPSIVRIVDSERNDDIVLLSIRTLVRGVRDLTPYKEFFIREALRERPARDYVDHLMAFLKLGDGSREVVAAIEKCASMHDGRELDTCVQVLQYLRTKNAIEFLRAVAEAKPGISLRKDPKPNAARIEGVPAQKTRTRALLGLLDCGESFESIRPLVMTFLMSDDWSLRAGAAKCLVHAKNNDPEFLKIVSSYLESAKAAAPEFTIWGNALLAVNSNDPTQHINAIWSVYKHPEALRLMIGAESPLEALGELSKGNEHLIDEIKELAKNKKDNYQRADLTGLLACWNVDLPARLIELKEMMDDGKGLDRPLLWIEKLGKQRASPLIDHLKRWDKDCAWYPRLYCRVILRRWEIPVD